MTVESFVLRCEGLVNHVSLNNTILLLVSTPDIHLFKFLWSVIFNTSLVNLFPSWFVVSQPVASIFFNIRFVEVRVIFVREVIILLSTAFVGSRGWIWTISG